MHAVLLVLIALAAPRQGPGDEMAAQLRAAIEMPVPRDRRDAAKAIARNPLATIDNLRLVIQAASSRPAVEAGTHVERAPIWADRMVEDVELVTYVPKSYDPAKPAPLIASFHGTGGSGVGMDQMWRATCDKLGAIMVAPSEAGPNEGYAWSMRERDAGLGAVRWAMTRFNIDPNRVYASGISRGGHLTWDLALRRPDHFAALAPFIGCPRFNLVGGQNNLRFLENAVDVPIRDLQGSKDNPKVIELLHTAFAKLEAFRAKDVKLIEFKDRGHDFDFSAVDWVDFFGKAQRNPDPDHVVFTCANLAESRAFWVEILVLTKDVVENPRLDIRSAEWQKLATTAQQVDFIEARIEQEAARVEVTRTAKGNFHVEARGAAKVRLLLGADDFDPAVPVDVLFQGKVLHRKATLDPKLMLTDYVERLDTAFIPIASIEVP
jgi:dienelactone hydrolase